MRPETIFLRDLARKLSLIAGFMVLAAALLALYVAVGTRTDFGLAVWAPCGGWRNTAAVVAIWFSVFGPIVAALPPFVVLWRGGRPAAALRAFGWSMGALALVWLAFNQTQPTC